MATAGSYYQPPGVGELQAATQEEQRLREMLMALEGQDRSAAPLQSGKFSVLNLAPLSAAMRERRLAEKLELARKKKGDLQGAYLEEVARRLRAFKTEEEGQTQVTPLLDDNGEAVTNKLPGNKRAFKNYEADPYPEVRAQASERRKEYDTLLKALRDKAGFKSIQAAGDDVDRLQEAQKYNIGADAIWQESTDGPPVRVQGTTQVPLPGGKPGQQANLAPSGAVRAIGGDGVSVTNNLPGDKMGGKLLLDTLPKEQEKAERAFTQYNSAQNGLQALADGAQTGYGADFFQNIKTLVHNLTGIELDVLGKMSSYGQLAAALAKTTIEELGGLNAQVSNTDREFMRAAIGGTQNDPKALERLLAIRAGSLRRYLEQYPDKVAAGAEGAESEQVREALKRRFGRELPAMGLNFSHPEAEASFLANWQNIPYQQALKNAQGGYGAGPASQPGDWTKDPAEVKRRADAALKKYLGGR